MLLQSPKSLHYPITVTELLRQPDDHVDRFAPLFTYSYTSQVTEGNRYGEEFKVEKSYAARFDSETEGTIVTWHVAVGSVIEKPGLSLVDINEPCKHETQWGGLCVNCGQDMTEVDYGTTRPASERAKVSMAHSNTALRVSEEEAARVELEVKRRLLDSKKLSLVVDLDQTIIHATVDPTVAEWMKDPSNPNYEAVKDVQAFQLLDDGPGRGCWYYIKMRPGLRAFLQNVSRIYELHIYTMGTRAYAMHVAKIVDPDGKIFGDRILSRDESGSLTAKSLQRLFPTDTKMVVIIDDRGDVWSWSKNLIKVKPYDFFVGIGDINSSFLPKPEQLAADEQAMLQITNDATDETVEKSLNEVPEIEEAPIAVANGSLDHDADAEPSTLDKLVSMGGSNDAAAVKERSDQQDEKLAAQLTDRPLLQKQKMLDKAEKEATEQAKTETTNGISSLDDPKPSPAHRQNLLQDDDTELRYLESALREVHNRFYERYRETVTAPLGGRVAELKNEKPPNKRPEDDMSLAPQVQDILPEMKSDVLGNVVMVFSGVVPLGLHPRLSDAGQWAQTFGAKVNLHLDQDTTHLIATRTRRTAKVRTAARDPSIKIVTTGWLFDSLSRWEKMDETPYIIEVEPDYKERQGSNGMSASIWDELNEALSSSESENGQDNGESAGTSRSSADNNGQKNNKPLLGLLTDAAIKSDKNKTRGSGTGEDVGDTEMADEPENPSPGSPVDDFGEEDWAEMSAEFEDDDEEDGEESDGGWQSDFTDRSNANAAEDKNSNKRKREDDDDESGTDGSSKLRGSLGSELQVKKRKAFARTSSLNNVMTAETPVNDEVVKKASSAAHEAGDTDKQGEADEDNSEDGFDADFEAELEAQLDAAAEESDAEEDSAAVRADTEKDAPGPAGQPDSNDDGG